MTLNAMVTMADSHNAKWSVHKMAESHDACFYGYDEYSLAVIVLIGKLGLTMPTFRTN